MGSSWPKKDDKLDDWTDLEKYSLGSSSSGSSDSQLDSRARINVETSIHLMTAGGTLFKVLTWTMNNTRAELTTHLWMTCYEANICTAIQLTICLMILKRVDALSPIVDKCSKTWKRIYSVIKLSDWRNAPFQHAIATWKALLESMTRIDTSLKGNYGMQFLLWFSNREIFQSCGHIQTIFKRYSNDIQTIFKRYSNDIRRRYTQLSKPRPIAWRRF